MLGPDGVIRLDQGSWVTRFTKFIGIGDIELAEVWSLYLRLKIADSLQIKKIKIEIDCEHIYIL